MTSEKILLVSADCHAGAPVEAYESYLPSALHRDYRDYLVRRAAIAAERQRLRDQLFTSEATEKFSSQEEVQAGGLSGAWDPARRVLELEREGIAAEVIFPDLQNNNEPPFGAFTGGPGSTPEQRTAGAKAYNRWLAELCDSNPGRHVGLALIVPHDIDDAVDEVRWAADAGMRGVILPTAEPDLPYYNHARFEPLWEACEALRMPLHTHSGAHRDYGTGPDASLLWGTESMWFNRRPFWLLLWSGAFERHPELNLVITEQGADWIPSMLRALDDQYHSPLHAHIRKRLPLTPSEYWRRQCFVGATFISGPECALRHRFGVNTIVWGSDYPHLEGTWPHSWRVMRESFTGIPEHEVRAMCGETAVDLYRLDRAQLYPIAARIGPGVEDLVTEGSGDANRADGDADGDLFIRELVHRVYGTSPDETTSSQ